MNDDKDDGARCRLTGNHISTVMASTECNEGDDLSLVVVVGVTV